MARVRYLLFLLSKASQAKTEHMEMKILQPIFGILVVLTKNEITKICNKRNLVSLFGGLLLDRVKELLKIEHGRIFLKKTNIIPMMMGVHILKKNYKSRKAKNLKVI